MQGVQAEKHVFEHVVVEGRENASHAVAAVVGRFLGSGEQVLVSMLVNAHALQGMKPQTLNLAFVPQHWKQSVPSFIQWVRNQWFE